MPDCLLRVRKRAAPMRILRCQALIPQRKHQARLTFRLLLQRLAQSFRLMVGVQDYGNYLRHMQSRHPELVPMTEKEFHRYCLTARFPDKPGRLGKCPC